MEGCLGEESFQMWELNRRLEAYLARVKALEEQNEVLSAELGGLRAQSGDASWRARADEELAALRALVEQRWQEKHVAEVARDNLAEEVEGVAARWQRQREARERTEAEAARRKRELEDEQRAQGWLRAQVAELQGECEALRAAHDEERAGLNAQAAALSLRSPAPPRASPAPAPEVEELARQLGEAWRGAVRGYQERVADMETSLGQARERLGRAVQGAREGRLELQQLRAERGGLLERRAALEQRVDSQWQERLRATEKFQLAVEGLEQEKENLQKQIAQILEGRQQLAHLKMSLSLEVATYRTLLEAENSRLQPPGSGSKAALGFPGPKLELHFPETPGSREGPLPSLLSPSILSSPLPDTLHTPKPAFLKSQEFLQTRTPTLASTPIPPTPQGPCPAAEAMLRTRAAPLSLPQPQPQAVEPQAPEALQVNTQPMVPASLLPEPEEPGGERLEVRADQTPTDTMVPPLIPDAPSAEAKGEELSGFRVSSSVQEEGQRPVWELAERETVLEAQRVSSLQQEVRQDEKDLDSKETGDPLEPKEEEATGSLEQEIQEPPLPLGKEDRENLQSPEEEDQEPLRFSDAPFEVLQSLGRESWEPSESLAEKDRGGASPGEKGALECHMFAGTETPSTLLPLEEDEEVIRPQEGDGETYRDPGAEMQDSEKPLEGESRQSLTLEEGSQQLPRSPEAENQRAASSPEPPMAPEVVQQETWGPFSKQMQEPFSGGPETWAALEKEKQEPLRAPDERSQQIEGPLENGAGQPPRFLGVDREEALTTKVPTSPGPDSKPLTPLEEGTQELWSQEKERSAEPMKALGLMGSAQEGEPGMAESPEMLEPTGLLEEPSQEMAKPLEQGTEEPSGSVEEEQSENSLSDQGPEASTSPEDADEEDARGLEENVTLDPEEDPESQTYPEEKLLQSAAEDLQRWAEGPGAERVAPERAGVESEEETEMGLREGLAGEGSVEQEGQLPSTAEGTWKAEEAPASREGHPKSPDLEEQTPVPGVLGAGGAEESTAASDLDVPQRASEGLGPVRGQEEAAPWVCPQVTWEAEAAAVDSDARVGQEQGFGGLDLGDTVHQVPEESGEEGLEGKRVQDIEGREGIRETLESGFSPPLGRARDPTDMSKGWEELAPRGQEPGDTPQPGPLKSEAVEEIAEAGPLKSLTPTEVPQDSLGPQPWAEGDLEAHGGLEDRAGALGVGGEQELGPGGLLEEGEESREESEADELGETLPDSTPLGLYLGSPASPHLALAGEQRPSPPGDTLEDQAPAALAPEGLGSQPWKEEQEEEEEEEEEKGGHGSELSEEFEDLATEVSLLPGTPRECTDLQGQGPQLEPAAWEGESDGFADEEENGEEGEDDSGEEGENDSGEEGEDNREEEEDRREPRVSAGSLERGYPLESGDIDMAIPGTAGWGDAESSGSEEGSDSVLSGRGPQLLGVGQVGLEAGVPLGMNGQGPSLQEELEHVNGGVMNGLELSKEEGQGKLGTSVGDHQSPLEEAEGILKTPWAGAPLNLGPGQFLQFTQGEGDRDSWSSGED